MNKRIICLILTVVMLALSLVGCAYSYDGEDFDKYVTYDAAKFADALKAIEIANGDFATDRADKVYDEMYAALAAVATNTSPVTDGKPGAHDKFYYCYYITFEKEVGEGENKKTVLVQVAPTEMSKNTFDNIQLGMKKYDTELQKLINEAAADWNFSETVTEGESTKTTSKAYTKLTSGKAEEGQTAFITYSYEYNEGVDAENKPITKKGTVTLQCVTLSKESPLTAKLIGYDIGKVFEETVKDDEGKDTKSKKITIPAGELVIKGEVIDKEVTITEIKTEFAVKGKLFADIEDVTYSKEVEEEKSTQLTDINGEKHDVAGVTLTYHIYAQKYTRVDELNAYNVIALVYGTDFTKDVAKSLVFGTDFANKSEEDQKALLNTIKVEGISATEDSTVFDVIIDKIIEAIADCSTKKSALTSAQNAYNSASSAYTTAKTEYEKDKSDSKKADLDEAEKNKNEKLTAQTSAQKAYDEAVENRDELIGAFVGKNYQSILDAKAAYVKAKNDEAEKKASYDAAEAAYKKAEADYDAAEGDAKNALKESLDAAEKTKNDTKTAYDAAKADTNTKKTAYEAAKKPTGEAADAENARISKGYEKLMYKNLENAHRAQIRENLAAAVYKLITTSVKVNAYPEKAVDEAYDMLISNYQYKFYNGNATGSDGKTLTDEEGNNITNYTYFKGSFKNYLIAAVSSDVTAVETYKDAKEKLRGFAQEKVAPVLQYSFIAEEFDQVYTDKEFKQYKKENKEAYKNDELRYGESTIRNGLQFKKLMDFFLTSEEKVNEDGSVYDEYKNVTPKFKA